MTPELPAVDIHLVSWNSLTHLPSCFESFRHQTHRPISVMVVDNGSVDGTVDWIQENQPHISLLRNTRNLGFSQAHNQALRITTAPYVLVVNPDIYLAPDWLSRGVQFLQQHPSYASYGGKLLRYSYSSDELKEIVKTDIIDSAGLDGNRARHFHDRGSGQPDRGQFNQSGQVFGLSGACVLLRRRALESITAQHEYYDEDIFAYKEDVDLAWRLQRLGWLAHYDANNIAYHFRTIQGQSQRGNLVLARHYRQRASWQARLSYRNHWLLHAKHEQRATWWRDGWWIGWYECKKFIYLLCRQPTALRGFTQALKLWPRFRIKAQWLNQQSHRTALEISYQWFHHEHPA